MKKLTTSEVAERLGVAQVTVNVWCLQGKFPNATREETARGPVWSIPATDLMGFVKPKRGRVPKPKGNGSVKPKKRAAKKGGRK